MTHQTTPTTPPACAHCQAQVSSPAIPAPTHPAPPHASPIRSTAEVKKGRVYAHVPLDMA